MKYLILIYFLNLTACSFSDQFEVVPQAAEVKIYNEWLYSLKINDFKLKPEIITQPPGVEQLLFSLILPTEGGSALKTHCVYYQVPYKKILGILKINEQKSGAMCPLISNETPWLSIQNVRELSIKLENFKLSLDFRYKQQKISWLFLLPNLEEGLTHQNFNPVSEKKLYPGMTFLKITDVSFNLIKNRYLGKLSDRMALGSAIRCQQIDKSCLQVGEYRCDECRYGWYEVVDYNCPNGGSKFCGQNHCGEKNEPACIRGFKVVNVDEAGICQNDLTPVLNSDHILICQ